MPPHTPHQANKDKMTFTIIRPGGLQSAPATGTAVVTENTAVCGSITREDTAAMVVKALFSKKADNKVLSAVDQNRLMPSSPKFEPAQL